MCSFHSQTSLPCCCLNLFTLIPCLPPWPYDSMFSPVLACSHYSCPFFCFYPVTGFPPRGAHILHGHRGAGSPDGAPSLPPAKLPLSRYPLSKAASSACTQVINLISRTVVCGSRGPTPRSSTSHPTLSERH